MLPWLQTLFEPPPKQSGMERLAGTPVGTSVVLVLTLWLGVYMNRYTTEIMDATSIFRSDYLSGKYAEHAVLFYLLLVMVFLINVEAQRANERERRTADERRTTAEDKLIKATKDLQDLEEKLHDETRRVSRMVQTLPPQGFLDRFDELHLATHDSLVRVLYGLNGDDPPATATIQGEIRLVLQSIANLIRAFDPEMQAATFHANVAWYRSATWLHQQDQSVRYSLSQQLALVGHRPDVAGLRGVLAIDRELSTTVRHDSGSDGDNELVSLVFPVPFDATTVVGLETRYTALPGAPLAWIRRDWVSYPTQDALLTWCEKHGAYAATVIPALRHYLRGDGVSVQSFVSIPIARYDANPINEPCAILNIHCDRPGLLKNQERIRLLLPLVAPLLATLDELLDVLETLQNAEASATAALAARSGSEEAEEAPAVAGTTPVMFPRSSESSGVKALTSASNPGQPITDDIPQGAPSLPDSSGTSLEETSPSATDS